MWVVPRVIFSRPSVDGSFYFASAGLVRIINYGVEKVFLPVVCCAGIIFGGLNAGKIERD